MKKIMIFILAFIAMLSAFLAAHAAVYFSLVKLFGITSLFAKNFLLWSLIFLGASFFISMLLSHIRDNVFSRGFYLFSGFWTGLLVNLLLFFFLAWATVFISSWLNFAPNQKFLAIIAILASIIYSVYGVWNSFTPEITNITVAIDDLPEQWVGKKIVQISDVHLGHVYRSGYFAKVIEKINSLDPEVVVITGDLFDGTDGNMDSFVPTLNSIKAPTFFVTGNHETYLGLEKTYEIILKTKLKPLRDALENINGLQFIGIDYPLRGKDRDIAKIIPAIEGWDEFAPSILLMHEPLQIESAKKIGVSLMLAGHTHVGQLFPFNFITSLVFRGYDYGFRREGSFAIYTSSGLGGWGPPMRTEKNSEIVEITLR